MITCQECGKEVNVITHTHLKFSCSGNLSTLKSYKEKWPEAETHSAEVRSSCSVTLERMIENYGQEEGTLRYKEYCEKLSRKNSLESFLAKGKSEEDWKKYNSSRAVTLENLIAKYGTEKGTQAFNSYREKQRRAGNSLDWFVEKYGLEEGHSKYAQVCKQKGITLENLTRKYGEAEGFKRYHAFLDKTKGNYVSLSGSSFIRDLVSVLPSDVIFHDGVFSKEFCIYDERAFLFDFVITYPWKLIVEFNGDFWHANPAHYSADHIVNLRGGAVKASAIWEKDAKKREAAEKRGFKVFVVWENEYIKSREATIAKVMEWISQNSE